MKNISKTYSGNQVLKNVSLTIKEGEIHGLVGENGRRQINPNEYIIWYARYTLYRRI